MMLGLQGTPTFQYSATPSRGANRQFVGDTYKVTIAGADANAPVIVQGNQSGTMLEPRHAGLTDSSGNYSESGQFTRDSIGVWHQNWYVGNAFVGQFDLVVTAIPIGSPEWFAANGTPISTEPITPTQGPAYIPPPAPTPYPVQLSWQSQQPTVTTPVTVATGGPEPAPVTTAPGGSGSITTPPVSTATIAPPTAELISGIPNNYLLLGGAALIVLLAVRR